MKGAADLEGLSTFLHSGQVNREGQVGYETSHGGNTIWKGCGNTM